jgi:hypothetical protein
MLWSAALIALLAAAAFGPALLGLPGGSLAGLTIYFFLGYCAIIVVAQLYSSLRGVRLVLEEWTEKKRESKQVPLR